MQLTCNVENISFLFLAVSLVAFKKPSDLQFSATGDRLRCCPLKQELSHDHHLRRTISYPLEQRPCASNRSAKTEQGNSKTPPLLPLWPFFGWPSKQKRKPIIALSPFLGSGALQDTRKKAKQMSIRNRSVNKNSCTLCC